MPEECKIVARTDGGLSMLPNLLSSGFACRAKPGAALNAARVRMQPRYQPWRICHGWPDQWPNSFRNAHTPGGLELSDRKRYRIPHFKSPTHPVRRKNVWKEISMVRGARQLPTSGGGKVRVQPAISDLRSGPEG